MGDPEHLSTDGLPESIHASTVEGDLNVLPSSSPAFHTLEYPTRTDRLQEVSTPSILPISLPPTTLRPLAFRTFTKKHNLALTSSALLVLSTFIGKHCGSGWREEGLAEKVLDEAAKRWKTNGGGALVAGDGDELKGILCNLEDIANAGKCCSQSGLRWQEDCVLRGQDTTRNAALPSEQLSSLIGDKSLVMSAPAEFGPETEETEESKDPRRWLKVVGAFDQPRLTYNVRQKHFVTANSNPSILAESSRKTHVFRQRYYLIQQRLLRNDSFQQSAVATARQGPPSNFASIPAIERQAYNLTPIANLLGRSGSDHMLLGLLSISPSGLLTINDLTGSITLNIQYAHTSPEDGVWFTPGMIVVVDGQYEDEKSKAGSGLDGNTGVGGTVGGIFIAFGLTGPPCERREITLGHSHDCTNGTQSTSAGFGWVDFLGVGSERAAGLAMQSLATQMLGERNMAKSRYGRGRVIILGEVNLDGAKTLHALRKVLGVYSAEPADQTPMTFVLMGNFVRHAIMAGGGSGGSIEYKEHFDSLASTLSEYPGILQNTTFLFVPGDNDPWASAFSAGAAPVIPRSSIPKIFTSRVGRAFATANSEAEKATGKRTGGEAVWTTNPTRLTLCGPVHEIVFFRDEISGRLRRNAIRLRPLERIDPRHTSDALKPVHRQDEADPGQAQRLHRASMDHSMDTTASQILAPNVSQPGNSKILSDLRTARKLVKTILDQGHLAPFPFSQRPVLWDYAGSLQLYPLPTALVLMDSEMPAFAVGLDGCHVMNPGSLIPLGKKGIVQWMEYNISTRRGKIKESRF